jgi:hypothetical protein
VVAATLICAAAGRARGQQPASLPCRGQKISAIVVHSSAPTVAIFKRATFIADVANAIHRTTNPQVIRRFLLLREGDVCDELRRAESERILRVQPFIAEATVNVLPDTEGGVMLDVRTTDELALVASVALGSGNPPLRFFRVGDANVAGEGVYLAADWRDGRAYRDGFGGRLVDNQLLGRPYNFVAEGHRNPLGDDWELDALHPFYTDIQRIAWRARLGAADDYAQFLNDNNSSHALRVLNNYFDVGGIVRIGPPGRLSLFGASITGSDERPSTTPVLVTRDGFAPDTSSVLRNRYFSRRIARLNGLWGIRDIGFVRVQGFDALTATQDIPIGFQVGTMFGRTLSVLGSRDDDIFMAGDVFIGAAGPRNALRVQITGEGRLNNQINQWEGVIAGARATQYFKPSQANTMTATFEFSGSWRQRTPFALTLSDPEGGVRGYASSSTPGARRAVARLEDRWFLGRPNKAGDFGIGVFADAGRLWAGDVPYGVNTPIHSSLGFSLLGTAPAASARLWRLDFAVAINPEMGKRRFEVRLGNTDKTTFFLPEPADLQSGRERTVPTSVFRWPQ